jgi:hypothetical protein
LRDAHEAITLACEWTDEKKKTLKGENIFLQVQKKREPLKAKPLFKKDDLFDSKK